MDDLAKACIFALNKWDPNDKASPKDIHGNSLHFLNVGTGKDLSIKDLASKIAEEIGSNNFYSLSESHGGNKQH